MTSPAVRPDPTKHPRVGTPVVLSFLAAMALNGLDATIVTPALPRIATDFGAALGHAMAVEWAFLVSAGLALPAASWAGNRWVPARVLSCCTAVFAVGCLMAVMAPSLIVLVTARALQGVTSGLMVPVGLTMAYTGASGADRLRIAQWTTVPLTLVPMVGPLIGGAMTQHLGWRSMFVLLLGLATLVCASTWWVGRSGKATEPDAPLDVVGLALVGTAILFATVALPASDHSPVLGTAALGTAALMGILAWRWCSVASHAVISLAPLRNATFRSGLAMTALSAAAVNALLCAIPILLVTRHGQSTTVVGLVLAAESLGVLLGARIVGLGCRRAGVRRWVLLATIAAAPPCAVAVLAGGPHLVVWVGTALLLVGICLGQPTILAQVLAFDGLEPGQMASGTVLLMGLRSVASAWGVVAVSLTVVRPGAALWCVVLTLGFVLGMVLPAALLPGRTWARALES